MSVRIAGRSSSHNTRIARVFAHELGVAYEFQPIFDMLSQSRADYLGNPALRLPILEADAETWFGVLNICRELARRSTSGVSIGWPETSTDSVSANAQELVTQGMATEVSLIMTKLGTPEAPNRYADKNRASLLGSLDWLEAHLLAVLAQQTGAGALSYFEVSAFCFITHLGFREIVDTSGYSKLSAFCLAFGQRESARATAYAFDQP